MIWYIRFTLKKKGGVDGDDTEEVTVYDYFVNRRNINLCYSGDLPCINVGKPKRPTYLPIEVHFGDMFLFGPQYEIDHID